MTNVVHLSKQKDTDMMVIGFVILLSLLGITFCLNPFRSKPTYGRAERTLIRQGRFAER